MVEKTAALRSHSQPAGRVARRLTSKLLALARRQPPIPLVQCIYDSAAWVMADLGLAMDGRESMMRGERERFRRPMGIFSLFPDWSVFKIRKILLY